MFVLDTRGYRTETSILGDHQMAKLQEWLLLNQHNTNCTFKIIASPVPVTPNYVTREGWGTYEDLEVLTSFIRSENIKGTLFISGDSHMQGVYEIGGDLGILEVSSSPIATGGVPLRTITGDKMRTIWDQDDFGEDSTGEQVGMIELDSSGEVDKLMVELWSSGNSFSKPVLVLSVNATEGGWEITGGEKINNAVALSSKDVDDDTPMTPNRDGYGTGLFFRMFFSSGGIMPALILTVMVNVFVCCRCWKPKKRSDDSKENGQNENQFELTLRKKKESI